MKQTLFITITSLSLSLTSATANARHSPSATYSVFTTPILGDLDRDCRMGVTDIKTVLVAAGSADSGADLNNDYSVDERDVDMAGAVMGSTCADRLPGDVDGLVSVRDFQFVLTLVGPETSPRTSTTMTSP